MQRSPMLVRYQGPNRYLPEKNETKFVYHIRQKNMHGDDLYSLNDLKKMNQSAYDEAVKKYQGREHVLAAPVLASEPGALWNDHIFFSPIEPSLIVSELKALGFDTSRYQGMHVYKVPISRLEAHTNLLFNYSQPEKPNDIDAMNADTKRIDITQYDFSQGIRDETLAYWKKTIDAGERPLLFSGIPHILVHGKVNVEGCEILPLIKPELSRRRVI